ncbi:MAG: glycosyltransferase [Acidobacteriaceae bacterium]
MSCWLSVVMPVHNGEQYIAAALDSLRNQLSSDAEIVIVDDGCADGTLDIVRAYTDLPIRLLTPGRLGNWVAASNYGLRHAEGEWACFLHQDDLWLPSRGARILAELPDTPGTLLLHDAVFIDSHGRPAGRWTCPLPSGDVACSEFLSHLLIQNFIAIPSPVFRRSAALETGGLDESLWFSADWDLWLRLGADAPVRFFPEALTAFRVHPLSQTASRKVSAGEWEHQLTTVLDRHLPRLSVSAQTLRRVERAARASIAINAALSAASRGAPFRPWPAAAQILALGPTGWLRYFRDSRIAQRIAARRRAIG